MSANHPRSVLDIVTKLAERVRILEGQLSATPGAAPSGMVKLATQTLTGTATDITLSISGASSYTALVGYYSCRTTSTLTNSYLQFNGDTGSNYTYTIMQADSTGIFRASGFPSSSIRLGTASSSSATSGWFGGGQFSVYAPGSSVIKPVSGTGFGPDNKPYHETLGGSWEGTTAITQVKIFPLAGNYAAGSFLTIYGIP